MKMPDFHVKKPFQYKTTTVTAVGGPRGNCEMEISIQPFDSV